MNDAGIDWDTVFRSEQFQQVARKRRKTITTLGSLAAIYYFSIPLLMSWAPELFKYRLAGGINVGTLFAVSQYPFGGLIVYAFTRCSAKLDHEASTLANPEAIFKASSEADIAAGEAA